VSRARLDFVRGAHGAVRADCISAANWCAQQRARVQAACIAYLPVGDSVFAACLAADFRPTSAAAAVLPMASCGQGLVGFTAWSARDQIPVRARMTGTGHRVVAYHFTVTRAFGGVDGAVRGRTVIASFVRFAQARGLSVLSSRRLLYDTTAALGAVPPRAIGPGLRNRDAVSKCRVRALGVAARQPRRANSYVKRLMSGFASVPMLSDHAYSSIFCQGHYGSVRGGGVVFDSAMRAVGGAASTYSPSVLQRPPATTPFGVPPPPLIRCATRYRVPPGPSSVPLDSSGKLRSPSRDVCAALASCRTLFEINPPCFWPC